MTKLILSLLFFFYSLNTIHCQQIPSNIDNLSHDELDSIISNLYDQGQYQKGLDWCEVAKQKVVKNQGTTLDSFYATYTIYSGIFLEEFGQYDKAKEQHLVAVNILEKLFGEKNTEYADALRNLGRVAMFQNQYDQAFELYEKAAKIFAQNKGSKIDYAFMENDLANLYRMVGNEKQAIQSYQNAKKAIVEELGKDNDYYATISNNLAVVYVSLGELNSVEKIYLEALAITKKQKGENSADYAHILNNLGVVYTQTGQKSKAKKIFQQSLSIKEKIFGNNSHEYAYVLKNISIHYKNIGEYQLCLQLRQQANTLIEKIYGNKSIQYINTLVDIANLYGTIGENEKAIAIYQSALSIIENNKDYKKRAIYITVLTQLGQIHVNQKKVKKSIVYLEKAINIHQKHPTKYPIEYTLALATLADARVQNNELVIAEKVYLQVLDQYDEIYGKSHFRYLSTLNKLVKIALLSHNNANGNHWLQKALLLNTKIQPDYTSKEWMQQLKKITPVSKHQLLKSLELLRQLLILDDKKKALSTINELGVHWTMKYANDLQGKEDKIRFLQLANDWISNSIMELSLEENQTQIFNLMEQNKSILLRQATASNKAEEFGNLPDSLIVQKKQLVQQKSKLAALLLQQDNEEQKQYLQAELNKVTLTYDKFQEKIAKEYPTYHTLSQKTNNVSIKNLQENMQPNVALIEYLVSDDAIFIICITKNNIEIKQSPIGINLLRKKIKSFHQSLSNYNYIVHQQSANYKSYTTLGYWFYEQLLAPVLKHKSLTQLTIIPDAELGNLPFESFLTSKENDNSTSYADLPYLLKKYVISYDYSATTWYENEQKEIYINKGLVGFAPTYSASKTTSDTNITRSATLRSWREGLTPLPDAKKEVLQLQRNFRGEFFLDEKATESNFKKIAPEAGVIHLAMHGLLNFEHPILSSLAFYEDLDSLEDNFLQAYEISKMNLQSNLVVLSACETGYGKFERGNGIASLARSFMYAGTPSLVVSLWQVNDVATSNIMTYFYENLDNGLSKPAALQAAKLKYLEKASGIAQHPAFWSPFIHLGNTKPIVIKSNNWLFYLGGGLIVLGFIFTIVIKRYYS